MCRDCVPPSTAERACIAVRTTLTWGCCAVNVEPVMSEWYRSQLTRIEMDMAASAPLGTTAPMCDPLAIDPAHPEAEIVLTPGEHTLQLVLGDEEHVPWDEQLVSERITITVLGNSTKND